MPQNLFNVNRLINTYQVGSKYYLIDCSRDIFSSTPSSLPNDPTGVIWTIDAFNTSPQKDDFRYDHVTPTNNAWSNKTGVSSHYNGGLAFEYFRNVHNRKSINGTGGNIISLINVADEDGGLLNEDEKKLYARLSVFVGGFTLEAVCNPDGKLDILDGVTSLVNNSLLRQEEMPDGEPRFGMLETIRAYAVEQLAASGEMETLRAQHAQYFGDVIINDIGFMGLYTAKALHWLN